MVIINIIKLFLDIFIKVNLSLCSIILVYRINKVSKNHFKYHIKNTIKKVEQLTGHIKKDFCNILNYKGTSLEPKWKWVENISFVYTWVDGDDINISEKKSKFNGGNKEVNNRDRSADELRYSLRSLKKYLPWHRGTIYIVTDNQIPKWLNTDNNQIKIINHQDIIPKYINPTFSSNTIECFLDKIPGISDTFIYLNDDFFFNNFVHPSFFFNSEKFYPKIFRLHAPIINESRVKKVIRENKVHQIYDASVYFTDKVIKTYFDRNYTYYHLAHNAYVCYRDLFEPFRKFYETELRVDLAIRFRCAYSHITLYLYQMLLMFSNQKFKFNSTPYYEKRLNFFRNKYSFLNSSLSSFDFDLIPNEISKLFTKFSYISDNRLSNFRRFSYLINNKNILLYNMNDKYNNIQSLCEFTEYMIARYPDNTSFEKQEYVNLEKEYYYKLKYMNETVKEINSNIIFENINDSYFCKMFFNEDNIKYIQEYLEKKNRLSSSKNISNKDEEEIKILINYDGGELEPKWKWIKNISIVYILTKDEINKEDEIEYSLHSIEKFLPWYIGTIYIIIQSTQKNLFLRKRKNNRIVFINPKYFISKKFFGQYTKEVIEMYLDKIPFISERFIYMNKIYYFKNFIHPRFFFNEEFFPKYNLAKGFKIKPKIIKPIEKMFFKTYDTIKYYFGNNYIDNYRLMIDSPIPLYRDLFRPVRKLYLSEFSNNFKRFDLLPMYLLLTYNIYGASQIYFPNYVAGFGKIRDIPPPILKKNRTIFYYGFDITSEIVLQKTLFKVNTFKNIYKTELKKSLYKQFLY
jgi:hypothetical protein